MATHSRTRRHGPTRTATGADAFFAENGWLRVPRLVQWMATLRCPLSCEHCLSADDGGEDMPAAQAGRLIEQVAGLGVDEFLLTGGEPLSRSDLPEIIGMLRANGVRWSLNTAVMPDRRVRAAIEQWPPGFVAVSIDGPEKVHDAFRGSPGIFRRAMESIAYFSGMVADGVAAGTTVTTRNFPYLPETFGLVLESGAAQWGLHLPVPEGRAAKRMDLFLSRPQLRELLLFAAAKRNHFPVNMADEIGYCGPWEPLVRAEPFFCGAGKAGCVVLPDGEVVPCTTLDRSTSAGNATRQPFREIWETGFAASRHRRPEGRCRLCRYSMVCEGGCWLQYRHGTGCFRDVWRPRSATTAAALAVCIGLAASGHALPIDANEATDWPVQMTDTNALRMQLLESSIIDWYASQFHDLRSPSAARVKNKLFKALSDDPGAQFFLRFADGRLSPTIEDRAKEIAVALQTKQRSLCLVGLAWRAVTEWCLEGSPPQRRTKAERNALHEITVQLGNTAEAWRVEIFRNKLDPFLLSPLHGRPFLVSKAGPTVLQRVTGGLARNRWSDREVTEQFLAEHPYAETMDLKFAVLGTPRLQCVRRGKMTQIGRTLRAFDLLLVPRQREAKPSKLVFSIAGQELAATLPPETELTYGDVLRLVREQNVAAFEGPFLDRFLIREYGRRASPLALPELLKRKREFDMKKHATDEATKFELLWALVDLCLF